MAYEYIPPTIAYRPAALPIMPTVMVGQGVSGSPMTVTGNPAGGTAPLQSALSFDFQTAEVTNAISAQAFSFLANKQLASSGFLSGITDLLNRSVDASIATTRSLTDQSALLNLAAVKLADKARSTMDRERVDSWGDRVLSIFGM